MKKVQSSLTKLRNLLDITVFKILLFVLLGVILFLAMFSNVKPEKLDISLFSVAEQTIRSPITIEDKESTEKKKKEAGDQVKDVYVLRKEIAQNRVDLITSVFDSVIEVKEEVKEKRDEDNKVNTSVEEVKQEVSETSPSDMLTMLKGKLTENVTKEISDPVLSQLLQANKDELSIAKDLTVTAINNVMSTRIPADEVENAKKKLEEELKYTSLALNLKSAVIDLGRYAITQNEFYDPVATEELRQQSVESVEPVKILQGQIIVEETQLINREVYRQLELVGMLDNENSMQPFIGLALIISIVMAALYYYFYEMNVPIDKKQSYLLLFSLIFVLLILLMKGISLFQEIDYSEIGYVFPAALGAMLIKILIDERLAILLTIIMAICGSIIFNEGVTGTLHITVGIYIICSGLAGILFLSKQNQRSKILQAGLFVSAVNLVVILSLLLLRNGQYAPVEYAFYFVVAFLSGITSAVLTIGLLPFFEAGFGILSTMRLIELSNPNHPLLRKILTEAPGTYHHSVMVANLAESACEAIGANGLLARVGCYYHDIGKTKRPQFFIENQMNIENPHDRLPPQTSKNIIIAHATDGAEMLRKYKMPREIVDIAEQHHGTTLLKYFFHKAKQNGLEIQEADYRYPGPKAQTKETAIIGIADSVEAAVRSMSHPTTEQIEGLVRSIISDRLQDGQLNECDLTLKELQTVADTLCETLKGIFHSRIEYPEMTKQKVKRA
ncbi:HD family phosphohydrolase [Cytobacillus spongiae]|uniref:HD family phosphohydrolase n=1 Tax=Cytobacillus spongiae TaxID=2901381 RepID=UPI001F340802|nr:HD family phosphohydrolase [Cytobacillus spongiae]UII54917.1 HD family phosphohydrolase [Cytobacillus spongiae]